MICVIFLLLIKNNRKNGVYNFCSSRPCSIETLFYKITKIFNNLGYEIKYPEPDYIEEIKGDIKYSYGCNNLLKKIFNFPNQNNIGYGFKKNYQMNNKILAFIPARANSKGVKNKNIKKLNGEPLVSITIDFAKKLEFVDYIVVCSDSLKIKKIAKDKKIDFILRPDNLSTDESKVESSLKFIPFRILQKQI